MYHLKTKWFTKWAKKQNISDEKLMEAIENIHEGLSSVNLGAELYKVRVASDNRGKSSSYRTLVVYRAGDRAVIVYGFPKNERDNLASDELSHFKKLAKDILALTDEKLEKAIENSVFIPIGEDYER